VPLASDQCMEGGGGGGEGGEGKEEEGGRDRL
jgi:hypothetical protein